MRIEAIDHVNIRTPDVIGTSRFFADVLAMEVTETPGIPDLSKAAWLRDAEGRAVVHLGVGDILYPWETSAKIADAGSGRIHHVAFRCTGYDAMRARLDGQGKTFHANAVPEIGLRQLFLEEPNGINLELNFFGD